MALVRAVPLDPHFPERAGLRQRDADEGVHGPWGPPTRASPPLQAAFSRNLIPPALSRWSSRKTSFGSTYGAAGSLVIVLVWVYYSAQLFFLGAEFTKVYTKTFGSQFASQFERVPPKPP